MFTSRVLILGGAYTYARVPLGFWVADLLGWERNPYDKLGHFMQGFVEFLGTQGDPWDTQSDMALALLGACLALLSLSRLQDRQIALLEARTPLPLT